MQKTDLWLAPGIVSFSVKRGTTSGNDPYSGFNACHYVGDDSAKVVRCREELCQYLNLQMDALLIPRQTHSDHVAVVERLPFSSEVLQGVDALVTRLHNVALAINTADCVPVLLAAPMSGVIAAAHCGWRGVVNDLLPNVIAEMERLGAFARCIKVVMGPSICADCFEVGEEVAAAFESQFSGADVVLRQLGRKPHVNLGAAIREKLVDLGLTTENILLPIECTRCASDKYFSARALGVNSGRMLSVILQRSDNFVSVEA